ILMIHLCGRCERLLRSLQFAFKPLHRLFSKPASKPAPLDLSKFDTSLIRNFSIIAHVDHGKSTLSDRLLECTGAIQAGPQNQQVLDRLKIERDRGITIKAQTVALFYQSPSTGSTYLLNLVDTPGHVDFSHEVHRSVAASDGVVLLVDANDGVQAQTIANYFLAFTAELPIIPVINKIDLPNAKPDEVKKQLQSLFGIEPDQVRIACTISCSYLPHSLIYLTPLSTSLPYLPHSLIYLNPLSTSIPYLPHSLISLTPLSTPLPYLPQSLIYLNPLSTSIPYLPHSLIYLNPLSTSIPYLPHSLISLTPLSTSFRYLPHSLIYLIPLSPSLPYLPHSVIYLTSLSTISLTLIYHLPRLTPPPR
ncbi:hypothetical protein BOX15_Mlig031674g2, partial [Macrostomum lignano]